MTDTSAENPPVLTAQDAERWITQHKQLEELNMQAHYNASSNSDPFVMEALITFDKLESVVLHELLASELWTRHVFPLVQKKVATRNPMRAYFAMYQQAVLANLLEVILYHESAAEALGDGVIDLADWCARQVQFLIRRGYTNKEYAFEEDKDDLDDDDGDENTLSEELKEKLSPEQRKRVAKLMKEAKEKPTSEQEQRESEKHLLRQTNDMLFGVGVAAVSILRYLTEHLPKLTLSLRRRLLDTHDVPIMMVPLIENPPWTRRTKEGKWQKFINHRWQEVPPKDLLKITPLEGQPWLTLYNILCDKDCRNNYEFHSYRRGTLTRTRKYMHQVLVDQLPILADLQRMFDEMSVSNAPAPMYGSDSQNSKNVSSMFVLQIEAEVYESVKRNAIEAAQKYAQDVSDRLEDKAEVASEELGVSKDPEPFQSEEDEEPEEPTKADKEWRYQWLCTAAVCLQEGFKNKDVGDRSLMGLADLYASDAYDHVTGTLERHEDQVEELIRTGGSNSKGGQKHRPVIEEM